MLIANETVARHLTKLMPMLTGFTKSQNYEKSLNEFRMVLVSHPSGIGTPFSGGFASSGRPP